MFPLTACPNTKTRVCRCARAGAFHNRARVWFIFAYIIRPFFATSALAESGKLYQLLPFRTRSQPFRNLFTLGEYLIMILLYAYTCIANQHYNLLLNIFHTTKTIQFVFFFPSMIKCLFGARFIWQTRYDALGAQHEWAWIDRLGMRKWRPGNFRSAAHGEKYNSIVYDTQRRLVNYFGHDSLHLKYSNITLKLVQEA